MKNLIIKDLEKNGFRFITNNDKIEIFDDNDYFAINLYKQQNGLIGGSGPQIWNNAGRLKIHATKQVFRKRKNDIIIYMLDNDQKREIKFFKKVGFKEINHFNNSNTGNDITVMLFSKET